MASSLPKSIFRFSEIPYDFQIIRLSILNNIDHYFFLQDKYWYAVKFVRLFRELSIHLQWYECNLSNLYTESSRFDLNAEVEGNGFRSFCLIFERCFNRCHKFSNKLCANRNSMLFRPDIYVKELQNLVDILVGLKPGLTFIQKMLIDNPDGDLMIAEKIFTAEELIMECGNIGQLACYGRYQGFYYCTSMERILQGVSTIVATFSELYQNSGGPIFKAASTLINGLKCALNPELRAKQIIDVAQNSSIEFLQAFWSLNESPFMKALPRWVCPALEIHEEIFVPPVPVELLSMEFKTVTIPVPSSHLDPAPIRCLLLSTVYRMGQTHKSTRITKYEKQSKHLIFHCHGGGFISQRPESHEIYLRHWAKDLDVPILSVDYTLSPEAPFPRALEEVLLVYSWAINNSEQLGWTGENIYFAGDSAGGNILIGLVLKIISLDIRKPNAILCAYTPLILDMVPSPSRLLCWIDPLLPLGFMISCLDAYAGSLQTDEAEYIEHSSTSGQRSRKISSISEIFDSSMHFLKQSEWIEVEANEPVVHKKISTNIISNAFAQMNTNTYVENFTNEYCMEIESLDSYDLEEHTTSILSLPLDFMFDIKIKGLFLGKLSIQKMSQVLEETQLYKKFISPFLPFKKEEQNKNESCNKSSILQKMKKLKIISKNPYMSPLLASNDVLRKMPPVYFVSPNFDPCLDDSISFSKRLLALNVPVVVDILDGLPHGFLNFLPFSQEAHDGSNICVKRLKEAFCIV